MVSTLSPKAKATPRKPIPKPGNAAAQTALPHPQNTNQKVPMNSAAERFPRVITILLLNGVGSKNKRILQEKQQKSACSKWQEARPAHLYFSGVRIGQAVEK